MKKIQLLNAVIWAIVILSSSWLFRESTNVGYLLVILIMGAGLTNSLFTSALKKTPVKECQK